MIAALALCVAAPAAAQSPFQKTTPVEMRVGVDDLNLENDFGVERLATRILTRMYAICGKPGTFMLGYVSIGGGKEERAECKAGLKVAPDTSPAVRKAFALALSRFQY